MWFKSEDSSNRGSKENRLITACAKIELIKELLKYLNL